MQGGHRPAIIQLVKRSSCFPMWFTCHSKLLVLTMRCERRLSSVRWRRKTRDHALGDLLGRASIPPPCPDPPPRPTMPRPALPVGCPGVRVRQNS